MPTAELPRLRNFRKIVTKDMEGEEADLQGRKVVVIVVEISPVLRAEVAQLCQLLESLELIEKPQPRREEKYNATCGCQRSAAQSCRWM